MKKLTTLSLFLLSIIALVSGPTLAKNFPNDINNVDFSLYEENYSKNSIKQVSLGGEHSAVITNDGTNDHLYTWGNNNSGELGRKGDNKIPGEVIALNNKGTIKQVSLGFNHSAAITTDAERKDHLYTWGSNQYGQLGRDGENKIPGEVNFKEETIKLVSLGGFHSAVITNDLINDHLYTWGRNNYGQLGIGTTDQKTIPQEVDINGNGMLGENEYLKKYL